VRTPHGCGPGTGAVNIEPTPPLEPDYLPPSGIIDHSHHPLDDSCHGLVLVRSIQRQASKILNLNFFLIPGRQPLAQMNNGGACVCRGGERCEKDPVPYLSARAWVLTVYLPLTGCRKGSPNNECSGYGVPPCDHRPAEGIRHQRGGGEGRGGERAQSRSA